MEFTLQELIAVVDGLYQVSLSRSAMSALDKAEEELKQRGYKRVRVPQPKVKYQKKTHYKTEYVKING
jgi:hypothetical protein